MNWIPERHAFAPDAGPQDRLLPGSRLKVRWSSKTSLRHFCNYKKNGTSLNNPLKNNLRSEETS